MISIGLSLATILATSANWANSEKFDILAVSASASRLADCCATGLLKTILMIGSLVVPDLSEVGLKKPSTVATWVVLMSLRDLVNSCKVPMLTESGLSKIFFIINT